MLRNRSFDYIVYKNQTKIKDGLVTVSRIDQDYIYLNDLASGVNYPNFHMIRKPSSDAIYDFEDESIDLVSIDANHSYESVRLILKYGFLW